MKIREKLFYIFLAAMFGGLFLIRTIFVYGAADQDAEKVRKEQIRRLQAEQNAYNEAIAQEAFGEIWNTVQKTEVHWETSDNTLFDFYGKLNIFYYYGAGEEASRMLILFEENRRYDYIMVSDYTIEVGLK